jgi:hypothetical protein
MARRSGAWHAPRMRSSAALLAAALACAGARTPPAGGPPAPARPAPDASSTRPGAALSRFAGAVERERWDEAYALLSARWRARLTPSRLAADFGAAGPIGRDAAARVRALLASGAAAEVKGDRAALQVGEGLAARLVREGDSWRVDALE